MSRGVREEELVVDLDELTDFSSILYCTGKFSLIFCFESSMSDVWAKYNSIFGQVGRAIVLVESPISYPKLE